MHSRLLCYCSSSRIALALALCPPMSSRRARAVSPPVLQCQATGEVIVASSSTGEREMEDSVDPPSPISSSTPTKQEKMSPPPPPVAPAPKKGRQKRPCPIPECKGAVHANIWNHLFQTHRKQGKYSSKFARLYIILLYQASTTLVLSCIKAKNYTVFFPAVDELKKFMELAKLQHPTQRLKNKQESTITNPETVKQEDDGTVTIQRMEVRPTSSGRERFGSGTKTWKKYPLDAPALARFSR